MNPTTPSGLPSGFDPFRPSGEMTRQLQINQPRHLFILDRVLQVRTLALLHLIPQFLLVEVAMSVRLPLLLIFPAFFSIISVWLWMKAPHLPKRAVPDKSSWQGPKRYPVGQLVYWGIASVMLLAICAHGIQEGVLQVPTKRGGSIALQGAALWNLVLSMVCAAISMLTRMADHFDVRNNELFYEHLAVGATWFGWTFFLASTLAFFLNG